MSTPMTPGSKLETLEDVIDLAWNNEGIAAKLQSIIALYRIYYLNSFCAMCFHLKNIKFFFFNLCDYYKYKLSLYQL